jgi:hypothetical protein
VERIYTVITGKPIFRGEAVATTRELTINYMDGKTDVLRLEDQSPATFIDNGVLNVSGSYHTIGDTQWYYFPLTNIRNYTIITKETTVVQA